MPLHYKLKMSISVISTGSTALDSMLGGGVRAGMLTNIFGASGTGKTQLCFQLCVNCAKPKKKNGLESDVFFMDCTNTFRPERISQMAQYSDALLDRIYVAKVHSSMDQLEAIKRIPTSNAKLIIIDNIGDPFFEYKESMGAEKHLRFMRLVRQLALYAINYNLVIVATNSVRFTGTEQVQQMDRSISNFIHFKIELSRLNAVFKAVLLQPSLERREALFSIADSGITDV
jgi:RecA/RadA recombinase